MNDDFKISWRISIHYRVDTGSAIMHLVRGSFSEIESAIDGIIEPRSIITIWITPALKPGEELTTIVPNVTMNQNFTLGVANAKDN
jgi:hypothetical protein